VKYRLGERGEKEALLHHQRVFSTSPHSPPHKGLTSNAKLAVKEEASCITNAIAKTSMFS